MKKQSVRLTSILLVLVMLLSLVPAVTAEEVPATSTESAYFTTSDWIWSSSTVTKNSISYFRHEYDLKAEPVGLSIRTSAHNHLKFYINGEIITGYVSPAPTTLPENIYYLSYDFTGAELDALLNADQTQLALAAAVQYMGRGGMNYIAAKPAFWAEVTVSYGDGSSEVLRTDSTWRALADTPYANNTPAMSNREMNMQIDYDARKEPKGLEWTEYGFVESEKWVNAVPAHGDTASYKLRPQEIPEGVIHEELTPVATGRQQVGYQVFDAGRVGTGWLKIRASAPAGTRICIRYSENLDGDVILPVLSAESRNWNYCEYYTFSGEGVEEFVADFDYKAFRYFEIVGLPELIEADALTVQWASTGISNTSEFTSSNEMLNKIYQACINTQYNNVLGMPVDCPTREQSHYLADAQLQYALLSYAFTDFEEINYKTLLDFASGQFSDGLFTFVAPSQMYVNHDSLHIPEWDLRYPNMLYNYYWVSGDLVGLEEFYDNAAANVSFYYDYVDGTGLLPLFQGSYWWSITDYPDPFIPTNQGPYPTVCNILLYDAMNHVSKIASLLGKADEAAVWAERAAELRENINLLLLNHETGLYYNYSSTTEQNVGVTAMAINLGVAESYLLEQQMEALSKPGITRVSVVLTYELFRAIMAHGTAAQKEAVYDRILTSWGTMIDYGDSTCWEGYTGRHTGSISHAWNAFAAQTMLKDFLGVEYQGVNYTDIAVIPFLPAGLEQMSGTVTVPDDRGAVSVSMAHAGNGYTMEVENTTADPLLVAVPRVAGGSTLITANGKTVFAGGKAVAADGVTYVKNDSEYVWFRTDAGTDSFVSAVADAQEGEFTLTVNGTAGGTVKVNGEQVALPYTATVKAGTDVTVHAEADNLCAFTGWSGTIGSVEETLTFTVGSDTELAASFEQREGTVYRTIVIDGPENSGLQVQYKGSNLDLPARVAAVDGAELTLTVKEQTDRVYDFVAWSGDVFNPGKQITLTVDQDYDLKVVGIYKGKMAGNLASGKTATANNPLESAPKWLMANVTDGFTGIAPTGGIGATSGVYKSQDISANPYELTIDLGRDMDFNEVLLYPRTDVDDEEGNVRCFPSSYSISVCSDGGTYTQVYSVADQANPKDDPVVANVGRQNARYLKITATKLGLSDDYGDYYVQLAEVEVYSRGAGAVLENLAKGKTATSNNKLESAPKWLMTNLTDGSIGVSPTGGIGATSGSYATQDISATPHELVVDLGKDTLVDEVVLYPRTDMNDENGNVRCFPSSYTLSVCPDGGSYEEVWRVADQPNLKGGAATISFQPKTARYLKLTTTKVGLPDDYNTYYVQIAELEAYYTRQPVTEANLTIEGTGAVRINGELHTLPLKKGYAFGTRLAIEPVANEGMRFGGWTGELISDNVPLYLEMNSPLTLHANFISLPTTLGDNLAQGKPVNVVASTISDTAGSASWNPAHLTDGILRSATPDGIRAYTSISYPGKTVTDSNLWVEIDLGANTAFNQVVLYPRTDINTVTGGSPNFPTAFRLEYKADGAAEYKTIETFTDVVNPMHQPLVLNVAEVNGRYLRVVPITLGDPAADDAHLASPYRFQLTEIAISKANSVQSSVGAIDITANGEDTLTASSSGRGYNLLAQVEATSVGDDSLIWSIEDENGFVVDIAELTGTNGNTPVLRGYALGEAWVVARFANGLNTADKLPLTVVAYDPAEEAAEVTALIAAIDVEDKATIEAARAAYDALSEEAKALVVNYADLEAAELYWNTVNNEVALVLSGADTVNVLDGEVRYTLSAEGMTNLASMIVTMSIPEDYLAEPVAAAAEGWMVVTQTWEDGVLQMVLVNTEGANGAGDILTVSAKLKEKAGTASVAVTDAVLAAYLGEGETFVKADLTAASVSTTVTYNIFDVNRDGVVNLLDLTRTQRYYGTDNAVCDVNGDGDVNISDLILILNHYTNA